MNIEKGYSLIEMLVVLMIFSIIALLSLSFISSSVTSYFSLNSKTIQLKNLIILSDVIKKDLIHTVNISPRNDLGVKEEFFFKINNERIQDNKILEFVSYSSSDGLNETGALSKVKYEFKDGNLYRFSSNNLNASYSETPLLLLSNIKDIKLEVFYNQSYLTYWPVNNPKDELPQLLSLKFYFEDLFFNKVFVISNA
jgi:type II secretion system protein J